MKCNRVNAKVPLQPKKSAAGYMTTRTSSLASALALVVSLSSPYSAAL